MADKTKKKQRLQRKTKKNSNQNSVKHLQRYSKENRNSESFSDDAEPRTGHNDSSSSSDDNIPLTGNVGSTQLSNGLIKSSEEEFHKQNSDVLHNHTSSAFDLLESSDEEDASTNQKNKIDSYRRSDESLLQTTV